MRLNESFRRCVAYLYRDQDLLGSAFVMAVEDGGLQWLYVVTAGHIVPPGNEVIVRANDAAGGVVRIPIEPDSWRRPETPLADVAVAPLDLDPSDRLELVVVTDQHLATTEFVTERDVGPGDEIAFVGLFSGSPGAERNLPIIRFGNIARMNEEPVPTDHTGGSALLDAIMVEARSWGGHSGSPAFVLFPATRHPGFLELPSWPITDRTQMVALLGVVSGHWSIPQQIRLKNTSVTDVEGEVAINAGIALITPAQHIHDLLFRADVVEDRAS